MASPTDPRLIEVGTTVEPRAVATTNNRTAIGPSTGTAATMAFLRVLWTNYYDRVAIGEHGRIVPGLSLNFIIVVLLCLAEIKSQGQIGFPFETHPRAMVVIVTSLLLYGLADGIEDIVSVAFPDPISIYGVIARLGKMCRIVRCVANGYAAISNHTSGGYRSIGKDGFLSMKTAIHGGATAVYRAVRRRSWGKWVSKILESGKKSRIWLGLGRSGHLTALRWRLNM
ncbi:hypothetical protein OSB04_029819 [Centaurea solstitialis]|uniref:AP2/ERF domain-containing protein n=1 Tax=Centaurea solstitialis TaxID=347529 RepID=A0AA38SIN5_9ASTR|nr:hypothetical protein OSB04_029819 [Centaurea solstitialis]